MDQLSSDSADDMNAEKLPIVPTTSFTKPSVLVPVRHSAGRPHTGRFTGLASGRVRDGEFAAPVRPAAAALKSCAKRDHVERDTPLTRGS